MEVKKTASAGTLESSDVMVTASPNPEGGVNVSIESPVLALFEDQILATVKEAAASLGVKDVNLMLNDHGAIDCVIKARTLAALCRACECSFDWKLENKPVEA